MKLTVAGLLDAYRNRILHPATVIEALFDRIEQEGLPPVWISLADRDAALARARALADAPERASLTLFGIPFAVKDNIDVEGMRTTAGCPAYAYTAKKSAGAVQRLLDAGAILIGKTNMDQFATGLVGTRSPYGACSSVYDERYISGGSSSGSAVAVASGLAAFSLGTDTAGSGRVPAAFNNLVGLKPTRGAVSTAGLVPACRSLDCVSVFAHSCGDASLVYAALRGPDGDDAFSRVPSSADGSAPWALSSEFRFGCPLPEQLEFFGDKEAASLYESSLRRLEAVGGRRVPIDYEPFRAAAALLYAGPWVAERYAAVGQFMARSPGVSHPVVESIITGATRYSAVSAFEAAYRLQELRAVAEAQWKFMDVLALPTTGSISTIEELLANPVELNTRLGYYTNFVNLLDLAGVAIPAGFRSSGMPFGATLISRAWTDEALLALGARFGNEKAPLGSFGCVEVAVVGAHLSGQPLNRELTERGARLVRACRTAPGYRLYALAATAPPKPGLVRELGFAGPGIEVEVWAVPAAEFGSFAAGVPAPLGIGNAELEDGSSVKCFICESYAVGSAREITHFGGWLGYLAASKGAVA